MYFTLKLKMYFFLNSQNFLIHRMLIPNIKKQLAKKLETNSKGFLFSYNNLQEKEESKELQVTSAF